MKQTPFRPLPSHGSYFQCYSYAHLSDEPDKDFAVRLTREGGVATIPVSAFYSNGKDDRVLRFCFAKKAGTLEKAVEGLKNFRIE
jgi:methionine aminotransferase